MRPLLRTMWVALAALACGAAMADEPMLDYTVVRGDTLIGRGNSLLRSPSDWREVARINRLPDPNRIRPGQVLRIPQRMLRSSPVPARLVSAEGDVRVDSAAATVGATVAPGQRLATGEASSAVLQLGDGSRVKLTPGSDTTLAEHRRFDLKPNATAGDGSGDSVFASTMRLLRGGVEVLATKVLRAKPLEVETPTAVIGVRGTEYRVHLDEAAEAATGTEVLDGRVRADLAQSTAGADVAAGQGARLKPGQAPLVVALAPAPDLAAVPQRFERPVLRFSLPGEPMGLRVQVAADAAFDRIVRDERFAPGAEVRVAGLDDGQWQLRIRRVDAQGIEGYDARREVTLKARPEPPAAVAPTPRAKLPVGPVALSWAENTEATAYRVEVARDKAFTQVVQRFDNLPRAQAEAALAEPGVYQWRLASVRAGGDLGPWGDPQSFELRPLPTPPEGGLSGDGSQLALSWGGRPEDRQQVELARDAGFQEVVARDTLAESRWTLPTPSRSGAYFFRYRAVEPDGFTTPWSSTLKVEVPRDWSFLWLLLPAALLL
ncbi:MAG: FecR domain-containing protein [Burkholderiaceae bacterium]